MTTDASPPLGTGPFLATCALAALVMASYAFARPAAESLFLGAHGADALPWVWLAVALVAALVVTAFNARAPGVPLTKIMTSTLLASALTGSVAVGLVQAEVPGSRFVFYVWKDVYIVVLVEVFWTFANAIHPLRTARRVYGLFLAAGALGGVLGNLAVGTLAAHVGTTAAATAFVPMLLLSAGLVWLLGERFPQAVVPAPTGRSWAEGFAAVRSSTALPWMLALVVTVQLVITLIDYRFNTMIAATYALEAERTRALGQVYAAIDIGQVGLQLATGPILRLLGLGGALLLVPGALGGTFAASLVWPGFATLAATKVCSKAFDYSLFRAAKELLYIPLDAREKTQGKAVVDILAYRVAKGLVSMLLLGLQATAAPSGAVSALLGVLILGWAALLGPLLDDHRRRVAQR